MIRHSAGARTLAALYAILATSITTVSAADESTKPALSFLESKKPFVGSMRQVPDSVPQPTDLLWFFRTLNRGLTENPPPAKALWSMPMDKLPENQLFNNPFNQYAFDDSTPTLKRGADGPFEVLVQRDHPDGDGAANGQPVPRVHFE